MRRYDGSSTFDSAQFRLERRFSGGYTVLDQLHLVRSSRRRSRRLNDTDTDYEERFQDTHLPHRLVMNGIWELPFGRGRRFGSGANPVVNAHHRQLERLGDLELAVGPAEHDAWATSTTTATSRS